MYLVRLLYASTKSSDWTDSDIYQILSSSRENNEKAGVTGSLCFNGDYFLQCLEGDREAVNEIYRKIHHDHRHKQVTLLLYSEVNQRIFDKWDMLYVPESKMTASEIIRYSGQKQFQPYQMTGESALALCRELAYSLSDDEL